MGTNLIKRFSSMIITAIILIDLSFTLLVIYLLINGRSYYEDKFQTTSYNFAKLYEQIISDKVRLINDATVRVERELNSQLLNGAFDVVRIEQLLDSEQNQLPEIDTIRVTNANGDVLFGKGIVPDKQISYADRDFFKKHRDHTTNDLIITEPMLGKVSNKWIIAFTRCYHNTEGQFAGVISAAVPVEAFGAALSKVNLGPTGTFVMRYIDMGLDRKSTRLNSSHT